MFFNRYSLKDFIPTSKVVRGSFFFRCRSNIGKNFRAWFVFLGIAKCLINIPCILTAKIHKCYNDVIQKPINYYMQPINAKIFKFTLNNFIHGNLLSIIYFLIVIFSGIGALKTSYNVSFGVDYSFYIYFSLPYKRNINIISLINYY